MFGQKKKNKKQTIQKYRFGNFELRVCEDKIEVEDVVFKLTKHVYCKTKNECSYEYITFLLLLSNVKETPEGAVPKTELEIKSNLKQVEILVNMLANTNLIFANNEFAQSYYNLVSETIAKSKPTEISKEDDDTILKELETVEQMKEGVQ